jgi:hypothetical protein
MGDNDQGDSGKFDDLVQKLNTEEPKEMRIIKEGFSLDNKEGGKKNTSNE